MSEVVVDVDIQFPDGLAVDWVANNLYWTDSFLGRIECAWLDGRYRKTLIWKNVTEPHSLALDPEKGFVLVFYNFEFCKLYSSLTIFFIYCYIQNNSF